MPFEKVHNLTKLSALTATAGLHEADQQLLAAVQCSAGVRYGEEVVSVAEAVAAHHAALELSWYLAEAIMDHRGIRPTRSELFGAPSRRRS